jgi:hypothetical protein
MGRIDIVAIVCSALLLGYVLEAVRRRRLREEYSILWIVTASVILILAIVRPALTFVALAIGIFAPVNALFLIGFAFTTLILLHFSTVISRLARENRDLAQRYALLVHRLERANDWRDDTPEVDITSAGYTMTLDGSDERARERTGEER